MRKIYNVEQLIEVIFCPSLVIESISDLVDILNCSYGYKRDVDKDLGGYALILEDKNDVKQAKETILKDIVPEYTDSIECEGDKIYCLSSFLLSSDYSVVVVCTKELMNILLESYEVERW